MLVEFLQAGCLYLYRLVVVNHIFVFKRNCLAIYKNSNSNVHVILHSYN